MKRVCAALVAQNCIAGDFDHNLNSALHLIDKAVNKGAQFVIFPEMNLTGYTASQAICDMARPVDSQLLNRFKQLAVTKQITLLIGLAEKDQTSGNLYASHLVFTRDGTAGTYRKIHTAPFEKQFFTPGDKTPLFQSHGLNFGVQLCYDAHFPELTLAMALKEADIVFMPHASPRGTSRDKYDSWIRHMRARAFDNGIFVAACNQVGNNRLNLDFPGVSLFIGPDGNVISKSLTNDEHIHMICIDKTELDKVRSHKMRYFLPNRRNDLFSL